jgi:hypothetical protein
MRRRKLLMSYVALAKRSGVSMPTLVRTLSGRNPGVSFETVLAIATALGMVVKLEQEIDATQLREQQAQKKARRLVGIVQATSGLEAQAVSSDVLGEMTQQTVFELLAGSGRRLWNE